VIDVSVYGEHGYEFRTIDEDTGAEKGMKLERFDLIPATPLEAVARHYGVGAAKYTRKDILCPSDVLARLVTARVLSMPRDFAESTMNDTSSTSIPDMRKGSEPMPANGIAPTPSKFMPTISNDGLNLTSQSTRWQEVNEPGLDDLGSPEIPQHRSWPNSATDVNSVGATSPSTPVISITTTAQVGSGDSCVPDATTDSASLTILRRAFFGPLTTSTAELRKRYTLSENPDGSVTLTTIGDRNWERGYAWSKSFGALMRHAWAFWRGEDIDEETGSHHLAAVVFHAFALMEYSQTHPEKDDRPSAEPSIDLIKRLNDAMGHVVSHTDDVTTNYDPDHTTVSFASAVHTCETCHHLAVAGNDEPCLSCCMWNSLPNWEAR